MAGIVGPETFLRLRVMQKALQLPFFFVFACSTKRFVISILDFFSSRFPSSCCF